MTKIRLLVAVLATALIGGFGLVSTSPASAASTYVNQINNHADDCGGGSHWANTKFARFTQVTKTVDNAGPDDEYKLTIADDGEFRSVAGAKTLFDDTKTVSRSLTGKFSGGATYTVVGELKSYNPDGDVFDDNKTQGTNCASSWPSKFFKAGYDGQINDDWTWTYETPDEKMVNAATGQVGNFTGKLSSKLTASGLCRTSNGTLRWTVANVRGDRSRDFKYAQRLKNGKWATAKTASVPADGKVTVWTPPGTSLAVHYYNGYSVYMKTYAKAATRSC